MNRLLPLLAATVLLTACSGGSTDTEPTSSPAMSTSMPPAPASIFVNTVGAVPAGSEDDPAQVALQSSTQQLRSSLDTLEKTVAEMQGASGAAMVQGLAGVLSAAKASLKALGTTGTAIGTAAKDGKGKIGQAFAANTSCASLRS